MIVKELDVNTVQDFISDNPECILYFWSELCGPCHIIGPQLEALVEERGDLKIGKIDADENEDLTEKFSVKGLPTIVMFKQGEESARITGYFSKKDIEKKIDEVYKGV